MIKFTQTKLGMWMLIPLAIFMASCENTAIEPEKIWSGVELTFEKAAGTDPADAANQDILTDKVAITRGNGGGQIYNAVSESQSNQDASPAGTEWAIGTVEDINELEFKPFRAAVENPKDVVGKNLILHLIEDDVYLTVRFTKWSSGNAAGGGFAYVRSTP
ncbi:MAG: hypothetical protein AAFY71_04500 [Bacteroidota bacterium]